MGGMKLLSEVLLYVTGFHPGALRRKAKTRKRRGFWNSIVLMVSAPVIGYALTTVPEGSIYLALPLAILWFVGGLAMYLWSLRPDPPPPALPNS
jgi:undecaprenyl pyrophosphate phosphatase UppP